MLDLFLERVKLGATNVQMLTRWSPSAWAGGGLWGLNHTKKTCGEASKRMDQREPIDDGCVCLLATNAIFRWLLAVKFWAFL